MTVQDAERLLGLGSGFTADELKAAYKRAAVQHHPDKGGDLSTMQRINAAYDKLSKMFAGGKQSPEDRMASYRRGREQDRVFLVAALGKVKQHLNIHAFTAHFKAIFGEEFTAKEKEVVEGGYAAITVEFSNASRTTVLDLVAHISASERHNSGLGTADHGINMYVSTSILHNRRKIKLSQQNYRFDHDNSILARPEEIFPSKKLAAKKSGKLTKFSKKDVLLSFTKELHASYRDNWLIIPVPNTDLQIVLYRTVLMGAADWHLQGVYKKHTLLHQVKAYNSIYETEKSISWLIDHLRAVVHMTNPEQIASKLEHLAAEYKAHAIQIDPELSKYGF